MDTAYWKQPTSRLPSSPFSLIQLTIVRAKFHLN